MLETLFNWWNENIQYDYSILKNPRKNNGTGGYENIAYPYKNTTIFISHKHAPILLRKGVCESFSEAFKDICELLGVECRIVKGREDETVIPEFKQYAHQWNEVSVDGEIKTIDLDPNFLTFLGPPRTTGRFVIHEK